MRYFKLIGGLLLVGFLTGCETTQVDRYLTPELGTAIGRVIGAKITGTTYNGPIPLPFPGQGSSGSSSQPGYGGAGTGYGGAGAVSQLPDGMPSTPECQDFWRYARSDSCSSDRVMLGIGTCNVSLVQQKAAACNASGSRQPAGCPSGYFNDGRSCAPVPAGAEACAIGGYCPQGMQCRPNGGCQATREVKQEIDDLRKKLEKDNANSEEKQEILQRVNKELDEHRASSQNASTEQGTGAAGTSPSGSSGAPSPVQNTPPQTAQGKPAGGPGASSEPFAGTMTHPVYKTTPAINSGQGAQPASGGAAAPSKSGNTTSFVQDWLDGKPVDPVKLSPAARQKYYEQKARDEAAARAEAARRGQAEERAYQTTFGRASRYNTTAEEAPTAPSKTIPAAADNLDAEDDPSLVDRLSNTKYRVDSDLTPPIGQPQEEPPSYK
jgi:hypothetical protein